MSLFTCHTTAIAGVVIVERHPHGDARGTFERIYEPGALPLETIAQVNHSVTRTAGTIRGLHFQRAPRGETRLVSCLAGRIFDVAVDLRAGSPTYGQHVSAELSAENHRALLVPEGCAHGFQALTPDCQLLYLHSVPYAPDAEGGVHHASPTLGIGWPLAPHSVSARDHALPVLDDSFRPLGEDTR
ncbi:dTDP-4-dehydrorhamnose 3,5-epimerase family protein [Acuticoccus sp. MNP-M23]|uniref:dTDP-4-dehydrorhamnose 3,5-epimerase family protein n=1 Tax=Acuticoccus sp. MNP-M23 TaxID=3072793 RepID=UPI00281678FB|nr:dTDP-4-dehydrorhamnose 3,5-epimerase family protein [Acuticoccus sp. MNP-M23]WMS43027.1 dTDP-4-dehydrorhamnose 3,5-epimerase family protein [Acuticoccus sp. MNP-M23]